MITRYTIDMDDKLEFPEGELVLFDDYQREVAQLQTRVAELEGALREYQGHAHHSDAGNTLSAMRHFEKFESELARLLP